MVHYVNENQGDGSPVVHMIGQGRSLWPAPINIAETGESRIIRLLAIEGPEGVFPRFGYHSSRGLLSPGSGATVSPRL